MSFLPESYDIPHQVDAVKELIDVPSLGTGVTTGKYYRFVGSSRLGNDTAATLLAANTQHIFTISTKADFVQWAIAFFEDVT